MTTKTRRHILLVMLMLPALTACGVTQYQKFLDQVDSVNRELATPKMVAAICAAGAMLKACGR